MGESWLSRFISKKFMRFLGKGLNLREYFDVKYYIIDPSLDPDNEDEVQSTPDNEIGNNPLDGLIKVDTILASRDFQIRKDKQTVI